MGMDTPMGIRHGLQHKEQMLFQMSQVNGPIKTVMVTETTRVASMQTVVLPHLELQQNSAI